MRYWIRPERGTNKSGADWWPIEPLDAPNALWSCTHDLQRAFYLYVEYDPDKPAMPVCCKYVLLSDPPILEIDAQQFGNPGRRQPRHKFIACYNCDCLFSEHGPLGKCLFAATTYFARER